MVFQYAYPPVVLVFLGLGHCLVVEWMVMVGVLEWVFDWLIFLVLEVPFLEPVYSEEPDVDVVDFVSSVVLWVFSIT